MDAKPSAFSALVERVAEELHSACISDLRLFAIDLQVKFLLDESGQSFAHSLRSSFAEAVSLRESDGTLRLSSPLRRDTCG